MCIWETQHKCQERCRGRRAQIKSHKSLIRVKRDLFESKKTYSSQNTPHERHPESRRDAMGVVHESLVKRDLFKSKETYSSQKRSHERHREMSREMPWELCTNQKSKETNLSQKRRIKVKRNHTRDIHKCQGRCRGRCAQFRWALCTSNEAYKHQKRDGKTDKETLNRRRNKKRHPNTTRPSKEKCRNEKSPREIKRDLLKSKKT